MSDPSDQFPEMQMDERHEPPQNFVTKFRGALRDAR